MGPNLTLTDMPVLLLAVWLVFEGVSAVLRRGGSETRRSVLALLAWAIRPWAGWAAFNLVYRWRWDRGFNNRRTFPFFANLWHEDHALRESVRHLVHLPAALLWGAAVAVLAAAAVSLAVIGVRAGEPHRRRVLLLLGACFLLAPALHISIACLPNGALSRPGRPGSLLSSWHADSTMLYAVPLVRSSGDYMRRFLELQPRLRRTIHGLSHPPVASLSMYWIGLATGAKGMDIRSESTRLRYATGLTAFGALNVFVLYWLGKLLFRSKRVGLLTSVLWLAAPSTAAYATFAQDGLYAVFFNLALVLTWQVVTCRSRAVGWAVLLGLDFCCMTMLSYSWTIATTIFAVFVLAVGIRQGWSRRAYLIRGVLPLAVMSVGAAAILLYFRLDYLRMYARSRGYVAEWYPLNGPYQWTMALVGGQIDAFLLLGSVVCSAFFVALARLRGWGLPAPAAAFLLALLGVYAVPVLIGPNCLKMETARCWNWVMTVPIAFAAAQLLRTKRPALMAGGAAAVSILSYAGMRLFLNFAP